MKSKFNSLFVLIFATCIGANAQESPASDFLRHELNIGFSDLLGNSESELRYYYPNPLLYDQLNDLAYYPYPENTYRIYPQYGLGYKYHFGKNAIRISLNFGANSRESDNPVIDGNSNEQSSEFQSFSNRTGFERNFLEKDRFNFYGALDLVILQAENIQESENRSPGQVFKSENESTYESIGGSLALGVRYFIHKHLSFSVESRLDQSSYKREDRFRSEGIGNTPSFSESKDKSTGNNMEFQPLAFFSMNVHF